jgi:hypothetical protein
MAPEFRVLVEPSPGMGKSTVELAHAVERHWRGEQQPPHLCKLEVVRSKDPSLGLDLTGVVIFLIEKSDQILSMLRSLRGFVAAEAPGQADVTIHIQCGPHQLKIEGKKLTSGDLKEWQSTVKEMCRDLLTLT